MNDYQTVVGVVGSVEQAESAIIALQSAGFSRSDVSALLPDKRGTWAAGGALGGAGNVLGGTIGLLAGVGALVLPVGLFIGAGPLMGALRGASAGTALSTIAGALTGLGVSEGEAQAYENETREGRILLAVKVESAKERERAREIFEQTEALEIASTATLPSDAGSGEGRVASTPAAMRATRQKSSRLRAALRASRG